MLTYHSQCCQHTWIPSLHHFVNIQYTTVDHTTTLTQIDRNNSKTSCYLEAPVWCNKRHLKIWTKATYISTLPKETAVQQPELELQDIISRQMQATSGERNLYDGIKFRESLLIADCRQDSSHQHHVNDKDIHRNIYKHQNERNSCLPHIPEQSKNDWNCRGNSRKTTVAHLDKPTNTTECVGW